MSLRKRASQEGASDQWKDLTTHTPSSRPFAPVSCGFADRIAGVGLAVRSTKKRERRERKRGGGALGARVARSFL